jgi:pyruvate/2-oxoglutarate dehydrogenase complex dihydrolipoamide dehydrogenase (E3) component
MTRFNYDLLCIGSVPAGERAVVRAAKLGKRTALVERGRLIGNVCVDTGSIRYVIANVRTTALVKQFLTKFV